VLLLLLLLLRMMMMLRRRRVQVPLLLLARGREWALSPLLLLMLLSPVLLGW